VICPIASAAVLRKCGRVGEPKDPSPKPRDPDRDPNEPDRPVPEDEDADRWERL
jgi:hypothetical protein